MLTQNLTWLVRIEDVDGSRTVDGAADDILKHLRGLVCNGILVLLSYLIKKLCIADNSECACTRKELLGHKLYPGCAWEAHQQKTFIGMI